MIKRSQANVMLLITDYPYKDSRLIHNYNHPSLIKILNLGQSQFPSSAEKNYQFLLPYTLLSCLKHYKIIDKLQNTNKQQEINELRLEFLSAASQILNRIQITQKFVKQIRTLSIWGCNISLQVFTRAQFDQLKNLYLDENNLYSLRSLRKIASKKLQQISLRGNFINSDELCICEIPLQFLKTLIFESNQEDSCSLRGITYFLKPKINKLQDIYIKEQMIRRTMYDPFFKKFRGVMFHVC